MKSVRANILEGYGRRRYKQDFIQFLTYTHASFDETIDHLETLHETGSLNDAARHDRLHEQLSCLGGKLNLFIQTVVSQHLSVREGQSEYSLTKNDI
jgi:four helix bundle protein